MKRSEEHIQEGLRIIKTETEQMKEMFIENARKVHGDKYDYSKVDFRNMAIDIISTAEVMADQFNETFKAEENFKAFYKAAQVMVYNEQGLIKK
jgi:hypothetical protein